MSIPYTILREDILNIFQQQNQDIVITPLGFIFANFKKTHKYELSREPTNIRENPRSYKESEP